jgi:hypothetical protein
LEHVIQALQQMTPKTVKGRRGGGDAGRQG